MLWVFITLSAALVVGAITAISLGDLIGFRIPSRPTVAAKSNTSGAWISKAVESASFGIDDLRRAVNVLKEVERARMNGDQVAFAQLVQREGARRAIVSTARKGRTRVASGGRILGALLTAE